VVHGGLGGLLPGEILHGSVTLHTRHSTCQLLLRSRGADLAPKSVPPQKMSTEEQPRGQPPCSMLSSSAHQLPFVNAPQPSPAACTALLRVPGTSPGRDVSHTVCWRAPCCAAPSYAGRCTAWQNETCMRPHGPHMPLPALARLSA